LLSNGAVVLAEFVENFGHIGTMRVLKGQVRDGLDTPVPDAHIEVKNLSNDETYSIDADDKGVFTKDDLPAGKYEVSVRASLFNIGEYTVRIKPNDSSASNKVTVIRLSPGCASGNSGVALVSKSSQRSFRE
jgi:hypothetical protein